MSAQSESSSDAVRALARSRAFQIGVALCIVNTIIGAAQPVLTRWGAVNLDPLLFCTGAVVVASACAIPALAWRGELANLYDRRYRVRLCVMGLIGTVTTSLTVTYGLHEISAVAGVLLLQSEPIFSVLLAAIFVGERPSWLQLGATAIVLGGILSAFAGGTFSPWWAAMLVFVTPLFWQISHVIGLRIMPPLTPFSIAGGRFFYATFFLLAMLLGLRAQSLPQLANPGAIAAIVATGVFVYFLSALTWYGAINLLSLAWTTALVVPGIPLLAMLFALMFLGEPITMRELGGIAIAIVGVLILVLGAEPHRMVPDAEAAEAIHQPIN